MSVGESGRESERERERERETRNDVSVDVNWLQLAGQWPEKLRYAGSATKRMAESEPQYESPNKCA
jgi:hypothetical protein